MAVPILVTKLFIPAVRPELVRRPRLIEQLNRGLSRKLTLISAPAGFGKTTLVTEWLQSKGDVSTSPFVFGWLSLDEGDNDPTRFLTYFIHSLNRIDGFASLGQGALALLKSPQPPPVETVLTPLINDLAGISEKIVFVFDDCHLIESQAVYNALTFLLEHLPPQLHLVITTREDPLLPLSRLRARGQMTEFRGTDLRFTEPEATEFLNQMMGLNLSPEDIAALESRTEGWIAGLQLAAISLQDTTDTAQQIRSFTGSNRLVLDYLIEEVLTQQSDSIQNFLLQTSILDQLSGPLCDAVCFGFSATCTDQPNSQTILEELDRANLFVISLDNERRWFRYHHLFADLLLQQMLRTNPTGIPELHHRASLWFEQNGFFDEAIRHALQAKDFNRSAALIANLADPLWERGEHVKLRLWLAKLPEEELCNQPQLCVYHAWFLFSTGQQELAQKYLQVIEDAFEPIPNQSSDKTLSFSETERLKLQGRLGAIWSLICTWQEDFPGIIRHAGLAINYLLPGDPWRRLAAMALGDAQYYQGDVLAAYQTRLETLADCRPEDDLFFYMVANLKVATSLREIGKLNETIQICQQQLEFAKTHGLMQTIFVGWALTLWAVALAEQNKLDEALEFANQALALTLGGDFAFLCFSYIVVAKTHFYRGDYTNAETNLQKLAEIEQTNDIPFYTAGSLVSWQARLMLVQNRLVDAEKWITAQDCEGNLKKLITYDHILIVKARLLLALGNLDEAAALLARLQAACEAAGHTARTIEILVLQALTRQAAGEMDLAYQFLGKALNLAEPGGFVRVFVDEGPPMARLLYELLAQIDPLSEQVSTEYVQQLLAAFPEVESQQVPSAAPQNPDEAWIEPLSERELEVLRLIAEGLTNQAIASQLYLSLNTVKAHTRTIYSKLDVNSRTQAAARARALGLISTD